MKGRLLSPQHQDKARKVGLIFSAIKFLRRGFSLLSLSMGKCLKEPLMALSLQRHSPVCRRRIWAADHMAHLFHSPADLIKGHFGNSSVLRATKSCGGRNGGGKTNVKILGWYCAATGQREDENGWKSLSPLGSAACWAAGPGGQNICQLGSSYYEWIAFVLLGAGMSVYLFAQQKAM